MDQAERTMIDNLKTNTGKSLEEWISIVKATKFEKHGEIVKFLKENHSFTHGYANLVAHKSKGSDAGSADDLNSLIEKQYKGKEHFIPMYEKLITIITGFGNDIEIAPKNAYVSLKRKKQFAILQPATKTRYEVGLNLKNQEPKGKLESVNTSNSMCSHKIKLNDISEVDSELIDWIKLAYENSI